MYESAADTPMIPKATKAPNIENILQKYYGDIDLTEEGPMCMGVPRHVDMYACLRINSNNGVPGYSTHNEGVYQLDRYMNRFQFLSHIGEPIIEWNYTPSFGFLSCKDHDIPFAIGDTDTGYTQNILDKMPAQILTSLTKNGVVKVKPSINTQNFESGNIKDLLGFSVDGSKVFAPHYANPKSPKMCVPNIYFGILPTPALNPSTDNTNFQNTAAYFAVDAEMVLEYDCDSVFPHQLPAHGESTEFVAFPARDKLRYEQIDPLGFETYGN